MRSVRGNVNRIKSRRTDVRKAQVEREAAWQSLSLTEQLKRLDPDGAHKQRAKIMAKIANKNKKEEPVAAPVVALTTEQKAEKKAQKKAEKAARKVKVPAPI